jgi:hypothetical protein
MRGISVLNRNQLASEEGLCCMELRFSANVRHLVPLITGSTLTAAVREEVVEDILT